MIKYLCIIFFILYSTDYLVAQQSTNDKKCFRAAVYEHIEINQPDNQSLKILNNNFLIYERVIKRASFIDAKIIVLPEYSFLTASNRDVFLSEGVAPILPELNVNLCAIYKEKLKNITQSNQSDIQKMEKLQALNKETVQVTERVLVNNAILRKLSCLASENNIYIAFNLVTIETKDAIKQSDLMHQTSSSSSDLFALSQSDHLINDKLTEQLNKINKHNLINNYEDYLLFNTELVMDNQGKLIAKYHKYNLYNERAINQTNLELVTFSTPFGKFGLATCADILFEHPIKDLVENEKIDHLIFSSEWKNDLPSLTSFNLQAAASIKYKINLLSSGKRNFSVGQFGTGIYNGKTGVRVQTSFDNHDRLLVADLPTGSLNNGNDESSVSLNDKVDVETMEYANIDALDTVGKVDVNDFEKGRCSHFEPVKVTEETYQEFSYVFKENTFLSNFKPLQVPFDLYTAKRLENTEGRLTNVCDKSLCCECEWKMNDKFNFVSDNYFLAVISRLKQTTDSRVSIYEENCALISYHQSKPEYKLIASTHFDKLVLRGNFNTTEIYPTVLSSALYLIPKRNWNFKQIYNEAELSFDNIKRPITFVSLYGRVYDKDQVIRD